MTLSENFKKRFTAKIRIDKPETLKLGTVTREEFKVEADPDFNSFQAIRWVGVDGRPYWVGVDRLSSFGLGHPSEYVDVNM